MVDYLGECVVIVVYCGIKIVFDFDGIFEYFDGVLIDLGSSVWNDMLGFVISFGEWVVIW